MIPFISFVLGYYCISFFYHVPVYSAPALLGMQLQDAVVQLSDLHLNLRIIGRKQENDLPAGTIMSQMPQPKTKIKANQSLYCVISTRADTPAVPDLLKKNKEAIIAELNAAALRHTIFYVDALLPTDICVAQWPQPGQRLSDTDKIIIYLSAGNNKPVIWPDFKKLPVSEVTEYLAMHGITPTITHRTVVEDGHICSDECIIVDQRPLPGVIVSLQKDMTVQLQAG